MYRGYYLQGYYVLGILFSRDIIHRKYYVQGISCTRDIIYKGYYVQGISYTKDFMYQGYHVRGILCTRDMYILYCLGMLCLHSLLFRHAMYIFYIA